MGKCKECKWWESIKDDEHDGSSGFCRRYPPTTIEIDDHLLPWVKETEWCGEFQDKSHVSRDKYSEKSIDELGLSTRAHNCLEGAGIKTIGHLRNCTERRLLCIFRLGQTSAREIKRRLVDYLANYEVEA